MKNAGARATTGTVTDALVSPLFVVWRVVVPPGVMSAGTRKLTCVLATVKSEAASLFTFTPTPFTCVGELGVTVLDVAEIPAPRIAVQVFGAIGPATRLASLRTPVTRNEGAAWMLASRP